MELCWRERGEEEGERERKEGKRRVTNKQAVEYGGREEGRAYHGILRLILMIHFIFGKELKLAN